MSKDLEFRSAFEMEIEARGGIVVLNGRRMVKAAVARSVMREFIAELFDDARRTLPAAVSADAALKEKLIAELDESERRLEKAIAAGLPIVH